MIIAVMNATIKPENISGLYGNQTHNLCNTGAAYHSDRGFNSFATLFQALFYYCLSSVHNCDERSQLHSLTCSSNVSFS